MRFCVKALLVVAFLLPLAVRAEEPTKFLRITRNDKKKALSMDTATTQYKPINNDNGVQIDLVAVVHIGDKSYYEKLDKAFENYDAVLYELVAPTGTRPEKGRKPSNNPIAILQQLSKSILKLESQLDNIDYTRKNFVHADLSPEGMKKAMAARGDDETTVALSVVIDMMRKANKQKDKAKDMPKIDLNDLLNTTKLRRMMAEQMSQLDDPDSGFGKTIDTILIQDRNKACMKVLQQQIKDGKKKIAIFYGAAHMPDFEKRLTEDYNMSRTGQTWYRAWLLSDNPDDFKGN